jgi:nucleoside-diphosphate-sugar epimerase
MTVLITGANGFVGAALCEVLRKDAVPTRGAVRAHATPQESGLNVEVGEIDANTKWHSALEGVQFIVHLAARVHHMNDDLLESLAEYRRVNVEGTANLALQAAAMGVRRFVFLSTVKVNGESTDVGKPFAVNDTPDPQDAYGLSKYEAEQRLWAIAEETGMEVVVLRAPLVYGPGVKGNFFRLLKTVDDCRPLPLGAICNQRSLIYLYNLVDILQKCLTHPNAAGRTFFVSDGDDVSTPDLIRRLADALGRLPLLVHVPVSWMRWVGRILGKQAVVDRLVTSLSVDISPLQVQLGWTPPNTMQAGLLSTAQWYQKQGKVNDAQII